LFEFKVKIDVSWLFLAVLIIWSLAGGMFPQYYRGLPSSTYWWMGVFGAIGLFASIVFHELWHFALQPIY
jgi:Zn-dependent protease